MGDEPIRKMTFMVPMSIDLILDTPDVDEIFAGFDLFGRRRPRPVVSERQMQKLAMTEGTPYWWGSGVGLHRNAFPAFDLFPRLTVAEGAARRAVERIRVTVDVARHGLPEEVEW